MPHLYCDRGIEVGSIKEFLFFLELTKMVLWTLEEAYKEAKKFVNLERELRLDKGSKVTMETMLKKVKRRISPESLFLWY